MAYTDVVETGVIWSENCIFPYDEVDNHILVFFLHSATSIIIFVTNSIVFFFLEMTYSYKHNHFPRACLLEQLTLLLG